MKTTFLLLLLANTICYAQKNFYSQLKEQHIDTSQIRVINKTIVHQIIQSGQSEVYWVGIFVNNGEDSPFLLDNMTYFKNEYKNKLSVILCSSEKYTRASAMLDLLHKNAFKSFPVYMIDADRYIEKKDNRYKGLKFRNDICDECRHIIIGNPYSIFFDKNGDVIKAGYMSKNDIWRLLNTVIK